MTTHRWLYPLRWVGPGDPKKFAFSRDFIYAQGRVTFYGPEALCKFGGNNLGGILPLKEPAVTAWRQVLDKMRMYQTTQQDEFFEPFDAPLSDAERSRLRFGRRNMVWAKYKHLGPRWGRRFSLWEACLPDEYQWEDTFSGTPKYPITSQHGPLSDFREIMAQIGLTNFQSSNGLYKALKEVTDVLKKYGTILLPQSFDYFINLETFNGFLKKKKIEDFTEDLSQWVAGNKIHKMPRGEDMSRSEFIKNLGIGMRQVLSQLPNVAKANQRAKTIEEWAAQPGNWGLSGSSKSRETLLYRTPDGSTYRPRRAKWNTALATDPRKIVAMLRDMTTEGLRGAAYAIQKQETGKVRAVVNSDDKTYLRMAYVSHWLEDALQGHPNMPIYMSQQQVIGMWETLEFQVHDNWIKVPLDQAHFDWQQSTLMIAEFCDSVIDTINEFAAPNVREDLATVARGLKRSLTQIEQYLHLETETGETVLITIKGGVLSGWRWTAMMDTIFNVGELYCARVLVRNATGVDPVLNWYAQGDDDAVLSPTYASAGLLTMAYDIMNFEINPSKFFLDTDRDEFLRKTVRRGTVGGYPARAINAIIERGPDSTDPTAGILRVDEQVRLWNTLVSRGMSASKARQYMLMDIANANALTLTEVEALLQTPKAFGGVGYDPVTSQDWMSLTVGQVTPDVHVVTSTAHGLSQELPMWEAVGVAFTEGELSQALLSRIEVSKGPKTVTRGLVKKVDFARPTGWAPSMQKVPLSARARPDLPITLRQEALQKAVREKDWSWIEDSWLDPSLRMFSDRLRRDGGNTIWVDWLTAKLPIGVPQVQGWSEIVTSSDIRLLYGGALGRLVANGKFNYTQLKRAFYSAEIALREVLQTRRVMISP